MGRAKLRMELIPKEKTRNTTYHKRKLGIMKKANEFTILCDVDTVIIIYPPNSDTPEIWPENPEKIKKTINCYKAKKGETGKRTYDLNDFYEDRKKRIEDELVKARKKNMEAKYATWFDELDGYNEAQLRQFAMGLEQKENIVRAHLEFKKRNMNVPFMFDVQYHQGLGFGYDQQHVVNGQYLGSYDRGWVGVGDVGTGMGSGVVLKREQAGYGYGYPGFDGGVGSDVVSQWGLQPAPVPVVHSVGVVQEFVREDNGVGEFVMDDHRGRFMGSV